MLIIFVRSVLKDDNSLEDGYVACKYCYGICVLRKYYQLAIAILNFSVVYGLYNSHEDCVYIVKYMGEMAEQRSYMG